jgi:hypothetical protein
VIRQKGRVDWDYIYNNLRPLAELKDAPELVDQLRNLEQKLRGR